MACGGIRCYAIVYRRFAASRQIGIGRSIRIPSRNDSAFGCCKYKIGNDRRHLVGAHVKVFAVGEVGGVDTVQHSRNGGGEGVEDRAGSKEAGGGNEFSPGGTTIEGELEAGRQGGYCPHYLEDGAEVPTGWLGLERKHHHVACGRERSVIQ